MRALTLQDVKLLGKKHFSILVKAKCKLTIQISSFSLQHLLKSMKHMSTKDLNRYFSSIINQGHQGKSGAQVQQDSHQRQGE